MLKVTPPRLYEKYGLWRASFSRQNYSIPLFVQTQSSKAFIHGIRIRALIITKCYKKSY